MYSYSIIVPVYNRPEELRELLESITRQTLKPLEVIIVEDGSDITSEKTVEAFESSLPITYLTKKNTGQGLSRNYGFERANGDYFLVFDSDCILPDDYLEQVDRALSNEKFDAFGGPDRAREDFTWVQRAIDYSMTSPLTTGGIRGRKRQMATYHPRSFNMGISKEVYEKTGGYRITRMGEDIEFSIRIIREGFKVGLIEKAYVFHRRRTSLWPFFKQLRFFGRARINVSRFFPNEIKLVHWLPFLFLLLEVVWIVLSLTLGSPWLEAGFVANAFFVATIFLHALIMTRNLGVAFLAVLASYIQLLAYGSGLFTEWLTKIARG